MRSYGTPICLAVMLAWLVDAGQKKALEWKDFQCDDQQSNEIEKGNLKFLIYFDSALYFYFNVRHFVHFVHFGLSTLVATFDHLKNHLNNHLNYLL